MRDDTRPDALPPSRRHDAPTRAWGDDDVDATRPSGGQDTAQRHTLEHDTVIDLGGRWAPPLSGTATAVDTAMVTPIALSPARADRAAPVNAPDRSTACDTPAPAAPHGAVAPVPEQWLSARRRRRPMPRAVRIGAGAGAALLVVVVMAGRCQPSAAPATVTTYAVDDELVVNHAELRKRREMTEDDFRGTARVQVRSAAPTAPATAPETAAAELEDRRARRANNPEDLKAGSGRAHRKRAGAPATAPETERQKRLLHEFADSSPAAADRQDRTDQPRRLVPAATRVRGRLRHPLQIRGGRAHAMVRVDEGQALPAGTVVMGDARASRDGLVQIRFSKAVLPGGTSVRLDGEAQDRSGVSGLVGHATSTDDDDDGSVGGDVADGTSRRLVRATLGNGLLGGAASDAMRSRDRRSGRHRRGPGVVSLSKGTAVYILVLDDVELERD